MGTIPNDPPPVSSGTSFVSRLRPHLGFFVVLVIFFILTAFYSVVVPLSQGGDELAHYRYIKFIAQTGRLPVDFEEREEAWYRSDWPPLYHLLVGWAVTPLDTTQPRLKDVGESPHRRLVGEIFFPRLIIYTEDVNWPWQDGILAWHLGRFISIIFSAGALVFTYLTGLELLGRTKDPALLQLRTPLWWLPVALSATALLAFTPRFVFSSAMLGDDSLFILLSAIFIWLLLRALQGNDRWWVYAVLGLLLGLSIATKYSTGLFVLLIIPVIWWRARQAQWRWWQSVGRLAVSWFFVFAGASWWFGWTGYYFNTAANDGLITGWLNAWLNTGPDVSMRRIFSMFSGETFFGLERPGAIQAGSFGDWAVYLFQTFWGELVLERDPFFPWAYLLALGFCVLAFIGLGQLWRRANAQTRITLGVLILTIFLLFPFPILRFFLTRNVLETGQGRHILYPAAQSIPILLMLGWTMFTAKAFQRFSVQRLLYVSPQVILLAWSTALLIYMAITFPNPLPVQTTTFSAETIPNKLKHQFGDDIQLSGYDLSLDQAQGFLNLTLFWNALEAVAENYRVRVQLIDSDGQAQLTWLSHPVNGLYPTRAWDKGDVVRDELHLPLTSLTPDTYTVLVDLVHEATPAPLIAEPLAMATFNLPVPPSLVDPAALDDVEYRLWIGDSPLRHRQAIPLSWRYQGEQLAATLLGPDGIPRQPVAASDGYANFIVGADWPSGDYRLQFANSAAVLQTGAVLVVANEARQFTLDNIPQDYIPVKAQFANSAGQPQVELLGYTLAANRVEPGGGLPLTLYWQSMAPVLGDYVIFDVLLDKNQEVYGGYDRLPREYYSTMLWADGEVVEDGFVVPVSPEAPPGIYNLHVGLYSPETGVPVSLPILFEGQPSAETSIVIGPIKVGGPPAGVTLKSISPQVALNQSFSNQVTLLGYDAVVSDTLAQFTLYWRVETNLPVDYTTFLHLRDSANQNIAQKDSPPAGGLYPTSLWNPGEIIVDKISVPLDNVPRGKYTPVVGLYDFVTGQRLPVTGYPANEIPLETIEIP